MIRLVLAAIRADPRASFAPALVFFGAAFLASVALAVVASVSAPEAQKTLASVPGSGATIAQIALFMMVLGIGIPTIFVVSGVSATALTQERRTVATWRLAGGGPGQIRVVMIGRLAVVAFIASGVGSLISPPAVGPAIEFLVSVTTFDVTIAPTIGPLPGLAAVSIVTSLAILGALRPAWLAARIPAIEAVREAEDVTGSPTGRFVSSGIFGLVGVILIVIMTTSDSGAASTTAILAAFAIGSAVTVPASSFVAPLVRFWSRVIPVSAGPVWIIARAAAVQKLMTTAATVAPLTLVLIILGTYFSCVRTLEAATGATEQALVNDQQGIILFAPGAIIGVLGSAAVLIAIGKARLREHAQLESLGASPTMILGAALIEPLIYVITAFIVSVPAISAVTLGFAKAAWNSGLPFTPRLDITLLAWCAVAAYVVMAAVMFPTAIQAGRKRGLVELARDA